MNGMMQDTDFEIVNMQEVIPENKKSARPGRSTKTTGPKAETKVPFKAGKSLKVNIKAYLMLVNTVFAFMPEKFRGDALDEVEIEALAESLDKQAQKHKMIYNALNTIVDGGDELNLLIVIGLIGMRRAARHGFIPDDNAAAQIDMLGGILLQSDPANIMSMANAMNDADAIPTEA